MWHNTIVDKIPDELANLSVLVARAHPNYACAITKTVKKMREDCFLVFDENR